ncbi:MAG: heat-inducible transcriptional repressor HrcA [Oscillospiraceae bacterium]|nr:heat-inducible transcriptional repressor HrcA [Oscillospiraceae bacterium]MCD7792325.1 heat-inducible transcriptional repressor HrcA [Oscillospiraceae bacterium]
MDISERKKKILAAVVDEYIASAEPVGSKLIAEKAGLSVSSATIRNELAELTSMGYLEQPHTSAGRVPTPAGYRVYVNELMSRRAPTDAETDEISKRLDAKIEQLDKLMDDVGKIAAEMTNYPAMAIAASGPVTAKRFDLIYVDPNTFIIVVMLSDNTVKNKLIHLPFSVDEGMIKKLSTMFNSGFTGLTREQITPLLISVTESAAGDTMGLVAAISAFTMQILAEAGASRAVLSGESKLLQLPEYRDPDKAQQLMAYLSDTGHLSSLSPLDVGEGVKVLIGPENVAEELADSSVVLAKFDAGDGTQGLIGVVGPTRMDYSDVASKLKTIADALSRLLSAGKDTTLPGFGKLMITDKAEKPER